MFEYKVVEESRIQKIEDRLNETIREGWEFVQAHGHGSAGPQHCVMIFRRERPS